MTAKFRTEHDSLGEVQVATSALWGAQTERARQNFRISGILVGRFSRLISALAMTKQATARANARLGKLDRRKLEAIEGVCTEIAAGRYNEAFPLDYLQGGAGTSLNMNANEVIANLANERLGGTRGVYEPIHPIDDVNASQSTNDVYPTAIRLSLLLAHEELEDAIESLADAFDERASAFGKIIKLGRTQLQDAVPMTLGQEFAAFAAVLREDILRLREAAGLLAEVNLGGTAIGTGLNAPPGYGEIALDELSRISGKPLVQAANLIEASWDVGAFVLFSSLLKRLAVKLSKIANDLRLLSSGPRGGLGEILLPQVQPGSSIMPGKVNPVIPEVVNQVAFQVIGHDMAITMAAEAGQFQLNAMEPLIAGDLHLSMQFLVGAMRTLEETCVRGIQADATKCRVHLDASVGTVTALVPVIGYKRSAELAYDSLESGRAVAALAVERGLLTQEQASQVLDPFTLIGQQKRLDLD
jgi:aspartate ammonia-lyase